MKWIASEGGPLILVPASYSLGWRGVFGGDGGVTDYDVASQVREWLGVIRRDNVDLLVLWGEPLETAFIHIDDHPRFIRWNYGPSDEHVEACLRDQIPRLNNAIEEIEYTVIDEELFLMDAAEGGTNRHNVLLVRFPQGQYLVRTYLDNPDDETSLVVHVFNPWNRHSL